MKGDMGRDGFFSQYCDLTEQDVSAYLLQNVDLFCRFVSNITNPFWDFDFFVSNSLCVLSF